MHKDSSVLSLVSNPSFFLSLNVNPFFSILGNFFSIEDPHNSIHLAVGGFDNTQWNYESTVGFKFHKSDVRGFGWHPGANGDLGHNEIAAFDPIFWIFHCNFGKVFFQDFLTQQI